MKLFNVLLFCFLYANILAQDGTLKGIVTDASTGEGLIGVNLFSDKGAGTSTGINGDYQLKLVPGKHVIKCTYIGFTPFEKEVDIKVDEEITLNIPMSAEAINIGEEFVISGSRYEKKVSEEVISIEIIKPDLIDKTNATRLDDVLRKVSGLNVADGQANIRAGSGWSYSIGSRVGMVLDGQNLTTPDRGSIKWQYLPLETIGQIEVLKGASSVLYGSSAMNGTIHLQTIKPSSIPKTKFVAYTGILDEPQREQLRWWDKPPRYNVGGYFSRAHRVNEKFEYVIGLNANFQKLVYNDYEDYNFRTNFNFKWYSPRRDKLTYGLRGNIMRYKESEFLFWSNSADSALVPIEPIEYWYRNINIDPFVVKYDKKGNRHEVRSRLTYYDPDHGVIASSINGEYIFSRSWEKKWSLIAGVSNQFIMASDDAFDGSRKANFTAFYVQADKKFDRLSLTGGMRTELYKLEDEFAATYAITKGTDDIEGIKHLPLPLMRFGLNYRAFKDTYFRFNIGQAFRLPSFAEVFTNYEFADIYIFDNPDLQPEYGWTSEIGFKQILGKESDIYSGSIDFAFYWQEYKDLIEFFVAGDSAVNDNNETIFAVGLKAQNISDARIAGYEVTMKNSFSFKNDHQLNIDLGYTYAFPINLASEDGSSLKNVGSFLKSLFKSAGKIENSKHLSAASKSSSFETVGVALLKYRNRHLATFNLEYENKSMLLGVYARYYSAIENGDFLFDQYIEDIVSYWESVYPKGEWVLDVNIGKKIKEKHTISLNIKNITNNEYSLRLAKIDPPRSYTLQYKLEF